MKLFKLILVVVICICVQKCLTMPTELKQTTETDEDTSKNLSHLVDDVQVDDEDDDKHYEEEDSNFEDNFGNDDCATHNIDSNDKGSYTSYKNRKTKDGYFYSYYFFPTNLEANQFHSEKSTILNRGTPEEERIVKGKYGYKLLAFDYVVFYTVDKRGYRAKVHVKSYNCVHIFSPTVHLLKNLAG